MLDKTARAVGQRMLSQNVVGPYRPPTQQQRALQERLASDVPWQPTWSAPVKPTLAQQIFFRK